MTNPSNPVPEAVEDDVERKWPPSPLERAKASYRPLMSVDELVGLERIRVRAALKGE